MRYKDRYTFVAFHNVFDCSEQYETAMATLAKDKWSAKALSRARFREDLHMHEFDSDVEKPRYKPFDPRKVYKDWGEPKARIVGRNSGAASSSRGGDDGYRISVQIGQPPKKKRQAMGSDSS